MGEETDGVVESVSKMQDKIKGLTGVDILTDSGAYKDTYTILYEIGQVWNDLENLDRSALLELMAGKNRANTLAAILNNMEDLEGAYEAALNADGSALQENLTYLDSIDGKIKLVTNSIQTMWLHFLDSNVLKFLLDVANGLIKIADKAGLIGSSLAIFSGYRATKKDSFISSIFDENLENKLQDKLTGLFNRKSTDDLGSAMDEVGDKINNNVDNLNSYTKAADGAKVSTDGLKGSVQQQGNTSQVSSVQNRVNEQSIRGVGVASIFAKGAVMAFKIAASALASALIGMVVQKAIEFFYNLAHAEEQAADRATDAISTYRSAIKELKDQKITTDELAAAYERLSSGVNTATNTNIGLTVEAYGEYIDVCNKIADIYPELITGYDAQGNAIINLKDNVEALTKAYEEAEKAAASQFLTARNKKDIWNTYENTVTKDNFWNTKASLSEAQEFFDIVSKFTDEQIQELQDAYYKGYNGEGLTSGMDQYLTDMFGIDVKTLNGDKLSALESQYDLDFSNMTDDIDAFRRKIGVALSDVNSEISSALGGIKQSVAAGLIWDSNYQQLDKNMQSIMDSIVNNLDMDMISQMGANSIDDIISGLLNGLDDADKKVADSIFDIQDEIAKAMSDGNQIKFDSAMAEFNTLVEGWRGADGEIAIDQDDDAVTQYLKGLAQNIENQSKNYQVKIQFQHDFEYKSTLNEILNNSENAIDKEAAQKALSGIGLDAASTIDVIYDTISKALSGDDDKLFGDELIDQYENYINALASAGSESDALQQLTNAGWTAEQIGAIQSLSFVMDAYGTDIDTVKAKLIELGYILPSIQDTGLFDLGSEKTQELVENFDGTMSSIKEAWNSLNDGSMTKSEFIELALEIPEAMDGVNLADDNWMVKAKENLEELNKAKADEFIQTLNEIKAAMEAQGLDTSVVDSFINYATLLQNTPLSKDEKDKNVPDTVSDLIAAYESYNEILEAANEILYDGQNISEDYYQSLKEHLADITVNEQNLSDAIDTNNGYIIKNASLLKQLVAQSKNAQLATLAVAKANSQLQYREMVMQLNNTVMAMKREYIAYGLITDATFDNISAMREQIKTLKEAMQQYSLLEISLSDAANAYAEYEAAKERDAQITYDESFEEMLKTIDNGLLQNRTGTEEFEYAVKAVVPEEYWDIEDPNEKAKSIHDYIDGDATFSKFFTVDADSGDISVTTDNVREFIEVCKEAGLVKGSTTGFTLTDKVDGVKDFADAIGITEAAVLALLSRTEDVDALWGNILTDVTTTPLERDVNEELRSLDAATKAMEDYWAAVTSGKEVYSDDVYEQLVKDTDAAADGYAKAEQAANDNAKSWSLCQAAISSYRGELKLSQQEADALARSLGLIDKNGQPTISISDDGTLQLTGEQISAIVAQLADLDEPAIVRMQLRYDDIVEQINQLQRYIDEGCKSTITIDGVVIQNKEAAQAKIDELTPEKSEIELTYNITETSSEEEKSILESYKELAKNGLEFTVTANVTGTVKSLEKIKKAQNDIETTKSISITAKNVSSVASAIKSVADQLDRIYSKTITLTINADRNSYSSDVVSETTKGDKGGTDWERERYRNNSDMTGNGRALGSSGLPTSEHNAVVGELGPEMVVDPTRGIYYTVGDHGTEMVDLPKGAIIYNHKQTEELLKTGHTSRGKYTGGLSFATGNAHEYGMPDYHPNLEDNTSFKNGSGINNSWDDAMSTLGDGLSDAGDAAKEFEETIDWIEIRMEELEEALGLLSAELENASNYAAKSAIIDAMVAKNKEKYADSLAGAAYYETKAAEYLGKLSSYYQSLAQNGDIAIEDFTSEADEDTIEAINKYREYAQKAADLTQQAEEVITEIRDIAIQRIDEAYESGKVRADVEDSQTEKLQNRVDLDEEMGLVTSDKYYLAMMENSNKKIEYLTSARENMQKALDTAVRNGELIKGSNEWYEQINELYGIDAEIAEATIELEEFQNAINDIHWDNFENLTNQIEYLKDQTQSLIDLMEHSGDLVSTPDDKEYWTIDDVKWTNEGLATLGLYAQQMEIAEFEARQYAEAIDDLNEQYAAGRYSESEYLEKLEELTSAQYDSIEAYYEAQDAIVDLHKSRVDAIKDGINKEIEAYEKLIEKKKEELNAEKDLYDFQKSTMQQQKNIAEIERKLAALANDNSLSAAAKRKQLEAELAEAQYELQDTYYNRSVDDKQTALDKELEDFKNEKDAELTKWEEYLTNVELVVADSLNVIQANASTIYDTLNQKAQEYDLTLSDSIMSPWKDGQLAVSDYQHTFDTAMSSTMDQLEALKNKWQELIREMARAGESTVATINKQNESYISATQQTNIRDSYSGSSKPPINNKWDQPAVNDNGVANNDTGSGDITVGGKINAGSARIYTNSSGGGGSSQYFKNDPIYVVLDEQNGFIKVRHHSVSGGVTGWFRKSDVKAYAKGVISAPKSGIVNIDELGEELVLRAKNGRLDYMTKGSGVVPADLTSNLMEWGKLDPTSMIEQNRPSIAAPVVQNKEINIDLTYGDILHIDEFHGDDPDEIAKIVAKQFEKHTKQLNNSIRKFTR